MDELVNSICIKTILFRGVSRDNWSMHIIPF